MPPRPSLPLGSRLPWVLAGLSAGLLMYGLLDSREQLAVAGGIGRAGTFIAFVLPRLVLPRD